MCARVTDLLKRIFFFFFHLKNPTPEKLKNASHSIIFNAFRNAFQKQLPVRLGEGMDGGEGGLEEGSESSLPDELWLAVFTFLADGDLLACALVCSRWHLLTQDARSAPPFPIALLLVMTYVLARC